MLDMANVQDRDNTKLSLFLSQDNYSKQELNLIQKATKRNYSTSNHHIKRTLETEIRKEHASYIVFFELHILKTGMHVHGNKELR